MQNNKINLINSSDIYDISNFINEVKKDYIKVKDENTLSMGIFGYLNNVFSIELQNSIMAMSEYANEAFPIRSKFEKSILTYAMMYDVKNINAVPSVMNILYYGSSNTKTFSSIIGLNIIEVYSSISRYYSNYTDIREI